MICGQKVEELTTGAPFILIHGNIVKPTYYETNIALQHTLKIAKKIPYIGSLTRVLRHQFVSLPIIVVNAKFPLEH